MIDWDIFVALVMECANDTSKKKNIDFGHSWELHVHVKGFKIRLALS